ncbi:phosphoribosylaminoimidazolesuccinocarboxamide synthase [archaeon SCG-AAA382B04]|nr:phosphoribosylaminoimidazolesuccinocarboxamide synthase [archaeon SCG-AAA382B04]
MGSVKDLEVIEEPSKDEKGIGRFHFSDRYSVFDWGEMPDHIENKGKSLCIMGAYFFEKLEKIGINTHYQGVLDRKGRKTSLNQVNSPPKTMEVDLVRVIEPEFKNSKYNYSVFDGLKRSEKGNFLIPLEIIYRNGLPKGSSVFRRLKNGKMTLEDFGLSKQPKPGQNLKEPIFDVSTKLEKRDRYIKWDKAQEIASLTDSEVNEIKNTLNIVNQTITEEAKKVGLKNEDGKIELAFDENRDIMVVDVVGTLDECRFTYDNIQVSKQIAREHYKNTEWHKKVKEAKKEANREGKKNWKELCFQEPKEMDKELKDIISKVYMSSANEFTDKEFFDTPPLKEVLKKYLNYKEE